MPWAGRHKTFCRVCGEHRDVVGPMSARGKCDGCGAAHFRENYRQLHAHAGPWFEHWRRAVAASVGAVLIDELEQDD